jgi:hypothetical protein
LGYNELKLLKMKTLKPKWRWFAAPAAACCFLAFSVCGKPDSGIPDRESFETLVPEQAQKIILVVEGVFFNNGDLENYIRKIPGGNSTALSPEILARLFDMFVEEKLLLQAARKSGLTLSWEEKRDFLAKSVGGSPDESPVLDNTDEERLYDRLLVEKYTYEVIKDISVDDEEIREYYQANKKEYLLSERVRVSQILVDTEQRAVSILRRVETEPEDVFRRLAREESFGPEAFKGGEMGVFKPGDLPYEMERVVFALEEGALSRVVESFYGFHIFRLDKRYPPELLSESDAAPSIRLKILERKYKEAMASHIEELRTDMEWTAYPDNLFFADPKDES